MKMLKKRLFLASDHRGVSLKQSLIQGIQARPDIILSVQDLGPHTSESVDYPEYAHRLAVALGPDDAGVLICGTGVGISMAANRYPHVRAALCHTVELAQLSRRHNDANVLVLGASVVGDAEAFECLLTFLTTPFEGGRHEKRVQAFNLLAASFWHR